MIQVLDLDLLRPPLRAFPDDVARGGSKGHISIAPATDEGEVDLARLEEGAEVRGKQDERVHEFTRLARDSRIDEIKIKRST